MGLFSKKPQTYVCPLCNENLGRPEASTLDPHFVQHLTRLDDGAYTFTCSCGDRPRGARRGEDADTKAALMLQMHIDQGHRSLSALGF